MVNYSYEFASVNIVEMYHYVTKTLYKILTKVASL